MFECDASRMDDTESSANAEFKPLFRGNAGGEADDVDWVGNTWEEIEDDDDDDANGAVDGDEDE